MEEKKLKFFISFSGRDKSYGESLKRFMERYCFLHSIRSCIYFSPHSNSAGDLWKLKLAKEIKSADLIIVLWTSNSPKSVVQLIEIGAGWILEKPFAPVIKGANHASLPPMLKDFHAIPWTSATQELCHVIDKAKTDLLCQ